MEYFLIPGIIILFVLASLVLPWVNQRRINDLRGEITSLQYQIRLLREQAGMSSAVFQEKKPALAPVMEQPKPPLRPHEEKEAIKPRQPQPPVKEGAFELQFGTRLPVWIGGVALALAGFFLVKYSIETGLLSPAVRTILGILFGAVLLFSASWIRKRPEFANGERISQALSGAGIAILYASLFAATSLYHLVPSVMGFIGMAGVTAVAVLLSLRHGAPIAMLGLIGGFLTPAMIGSNSPSAPLLFTYLYFLLAGFMLVIRRQSWWFMSIPAILGAFAWVIIWIGVGNFTDGDSVWLGIFILAAAATSVIVSKEKYASSGIANADEPASPAALNFISIGGASALMGIIGFNAGFGMTEWGLFTLLALGSIVLGYFNRTLYGFAPWLSMITSVFMLMAWHPVHASNLSLVLIVLGGLYAASGYALQAKSTEPVSWALLASVSSLLYYLIGYFGLNEVMHITPPFSLFWGFLALIFAFLACYALQGVLIRTSALDKQRVMAVYAATATAFLSVGLMIELPRDFLPVAISGEILAIAWIGTKINISSLRKISAALFLTFGFLLFSQVTLLLEISFHSLFETGLGLHQNLPIVEWPVFQLGLPAAFFIAASRLMLSTGDSKIVPILETAAIALLAVMGYYLARHAFHPHEEVLFTKAGFTERGIITNILFAYGITCMWAGKTLARRAVQTTGAIVTVMAIFRICYFDLFIHNPLWSGQEVGETPIFNSLLLTYGLPIAWGWKSAEEFSRIGWTKWSRQTRFFVLLVSFTLVSFEVRQMFHGSYLNGQVTGNAEIYSYSLAWILFGIGLLFLGTLRRDRMIRTASLVIMILTVGKVFLYDASELQGLFRVFSFLGLGLSLLGLSWFYTRFVFRKG